MRVHAILHGSRANGPGLRSLVFVQGCSLACPGCHNPLSHPSSAGTHWDPDALAEHLIRNAEPDTDGLTISGGEPAQQAVSTYALICSIHARRPAWSIGLFTGYTLHQLQYGEYAIYELAAPTLPGIRASLWTDCIVPHLDWVVAGPFDRTRPLSDIIPGSRPDAHFVASANQHLKIYRRFEYSDFAPLMSEVTINPTGLVEITGF